MHRFRTAGQRTTNFGFPLYYVFMQAYIHSVVKLFIPPSLAANLTPHVMNDVFTHIWALTRCIKSCLQTALI